MEELDLHRDRTNVLTTIEAEGENFDPVQLA